MKYIKKGIAIVLYMIFSYLYALHPDFSVNGDFSVIWNAFNLETFIMMLFVGAYLAAFWTGINKLFRN